MWQGFIQKLIRIGTSKTGDFETARRVTFSNQIVLFLLLIAFFYTGFFYWSHSLILVGLMLMTMLLFVMALVFNHLGHFDFSAFLIMANSCNTIYLTTAMIGKEISGQFFLTVLIPIGVIMASKKYGWQKILFLVLPLFSFVLLEINNYQFIVKIDMPEAVIRMLSITVFFITCVILYFVIQFYMTIFQHVKNSLKQVLSLYPLTERELEIISILIKGKNNKDIADYLYIEECTVKTHLKNIFRKLKINNRNEIMALLVPEEL